MKNRRTLMSTLAAATIVAAGLAGVASPAHAAPVNHDIAWDCTINDVTVTANVGDTITFVMPTTYCPVAMASGTDPADPSNQGFTTWSGGLLNWTLGVSSPDPVTIIGSNLAPATLTSGATIAWLYLSGPTSIARVIFQDAGGSGNDQGSGTEAAGPVPVHQGLPMPESGSCADVKDADYAWGTGLTGGWAKAWEPWVNRAEGKGSWACTRTLVNSGNAWVIQG
jgi:hypothetical protein